jgi:uncharacterized protein DUF3810
MTERLPLVANRSDDLPDVESVKNVRSSGLSRRLILVLVAIAAAIVPIPAKLVDRYFSVGIYPSIQRLVTSASNAVPFAVVDLVGLLIVAVWAALAWRDARHSPWARTIGRIAARTLSWCAVLYLCFLGTWGFNYRRVPLIDRLQFDAARVSPERAREVAVQAADELNALYGGAHALPPMTGGIDPDLAAAFAQAQRDLASKWSAVPARPKHSLLDPYFLRAGVDGMTDPFFLETLVASDLLPVERPFVVAHEWAHLAGITDEGEANFVGWLSCLRGAPAHRYSAWLFLFSELTQSVPRQDRSAVAARLAAGPRNDLRAIARRIQEHLNPRVATAGWRVYDRYLKANRVEHGTASYAEVVTLVLGVKLDPSGAPLMR